MDELAEELAEVITEVSAYLTELGFNLENLLTAMPLERLTLIINAINLVYLNIDSLTKNEEAKVKEVAIEMLAKL